MEIDLPYTEDVDYKVLLKRACKKYDSFTLVWRAGMKFNKNAKSVKKSLAPYLVNEQKSNTWPGTESYGKASLVSEYQVNKNTIEILGNAKNVWSWQSPNYPEDLAFYKKGQLVFASVAHEGMAWFEKA